MLLEINNLQVRKDKFELNIKSLILKKGERLILQIRSQNEKAIIREILNNQLAKDTNILSGTFFLNGQDILQLQSDTCNAQTDRLIWIPENPREYFHPLYSTLKQFHELLIKKLSITPAKASQIALQALYDLGLDDYWLNAPPADIPQRVLAHFNWIVALTLDPFLVIAEEPFENFDPLVRKKLLAMIAVTLHKNGTALLILSKNPSAYIDLTNQTYNLKENRRITLEPRQQEKIALLQEKAGPKREHVISFSGASTKKLQRINLELKKGQTTLIVTGHPSAAADLFKMAVGLIKPSEGTIKKNVNRGECFYYRPGAFIPNIILLHSLQRYSRNLGSKLTRDEIYEFFHGSMHRLGFSDPKATLLSFPSQISPEEELILCLILATLAKPKLLLLEGAFAGNRVPLSSAVIELLENLTATGEMAIMANTYMPPQHFHLCDQIVFLYKDAILESGPYKNIYRRPYHPYTECLQTASDSFSRPLLEYDSTTNGCLFRPHCPKALPNCGWTGRDLQRLLFSVQHDDQAPQEIKDSISAIGYNEVKGLNLEFSLGCATSLSWQDLIAAVEKVMATYQPALAEACLGIQYQKGLIIASFPPVDPPREITMKEGHRVSCLLY